MEMGKLEVTTEPEDLRPRTKRFAVSILELIDRLPQTRQGQIVAHQLGRAGTSVGANYRAARRGRSRKEFVAKLGNVEEEADECCYWLELLIETGIIEITFVHPLLQEANELVAIIVAAIKTARQENRS